MKKIYNENLIKNLKIILNVKEEEIEKQNFDSINNLSFTKKNKDGNQVYLITELLHFHNLQNLSIYDSKISKADIHLLSKLENLKEINFEHCYFEERSQDEIHNIKELQKLGLKNCFIKDYSKIFEKMNLVDLEISFPFNEVEININDLTVLSNLKRLTLEGCEIIDEEKISDFKNLEYLYVISTKIKNLEFIDKMDNLNKIYISSKYLKNIKNPKVKIFTSSVDLLMDDENYSKGIV